jgi:hypothetical protein
MGFCHGFATVAAFLARFGQPDSFANSGSGLKSREVHISGA